MLPSGSIDVEIVAKVSQDGGRFHAAIGDLRDTELFGVKLRGDAFDEHGFAASGLAVYSDAFPLAQERRCPLDDKALGVGLPGSVYLEGVGERRVAVAEELQRGRWLVSAFFHRWTPCRYAERVRVEVYRIEERSRSYREA